MKHLSFAEERKKDKESKEKLKMNRNKDTKPMQNKESEYFVCSSLSKDASRQIGFLFLLG